MSCASVSHRQLKAAVHEKHGIKIPRQNLTVGGLANLFRTRITIDLDLSNWLRSERDHAVGSCFVIIHDCLHIKGVHT